MSKITDYSFLFQSMFGTKSNTGLVNSISVSSLSSASVQSQLKAAGINTSSKQYQAVINRMTSDPRSVGMYTNPQAIKNLMSSYDSDGNFLNSHGVAGMDMTGKSIEETHQIIDVSEEWRQKMFDETKRHFIQENGVSNGDTTKRTEVYTAYQKSTPINDRLKGTWTLGQYERQYKQAMYNAVKAANPNWEIGQSFDTSILDNVTRESVDSTLKVTQGTYGPTFTSQSIDVSV